MSKMMVNLLTNEGFYKFGKTAAGAVYATTVLKAIGRPAFIYADKKSDNETKKYTAGKEFLYQTLCLGITVAMLPLFKLGGFKLSMKNIKNVPGFENIKANLKDLKHFEKELSEATLKNTKNISEENIKSMKLANGGSELGSFVGSILGLTIIAPLLSHEILHPIMKFIGLEKKDAKTNQAIEPMLDAKAAQPLKPESNEKINIQA